MRETWVQTSFKDILYMESLLISSAFELCVHSLLAFTVPLNKKNMAIPEQQVRDKQGGCTENWVHMFTCPYL